MAAKPIRHAGLRDIARTLITSKDVTPLQLRRYLDIIDQADQLFADQQMATATIQEGLDNGLRQDEVQTQEEDEGREAPTEVTEVVSQPTPEPEPVAAPEPVPALPRPAPRRR
jgi:hypothetical protein